MFTLRHLINLLLLSSISLQLWAQVPKDLVKSVPLWVETGEAFALTLKWLPDEAATQYDIYSISFSPFVSTQHLGQTDGQTNEYYLGTQLPGESKQYYVRKTSPGNTGVGMILAGTEVPYVFQRGRCLLIVTDTIHDAIPTEMSILENDLEMDGWETTRMLVHDTMDVQYVKNFILDWYNPEYNQSQSIFILGHVPVPYSGNTAYDGHANHYGAWAADTYYAEMDGNWTDQFVNETSPSRPENDNIPADGKFDQSSIPGMVELEIGRVDFSNLPAFPDGEIALTRKYLNKLHLFKTGQKVFPRRALIENNFASFDEGFGQSGWRNFPTFFNGDQVFQGNYEGQLDTSAYLCSYACGGGSYTSCGGVGTTANLWAVKNLQTVFTMIFGSYFGDWDSQNNFLRSALASGDILTNSWSGRPIWQLWHMGLGMHIGYSTKFTMNANNSVFGSGYGAHSTHIALLGDPTLRLFYPQPPDTITTEFYDGDLSINWPLSQDNSDTYVIYRKKDMDDWEVLEEFYGQNSYIDQCILPGEYSYLVKSIRLEHTGSGTFYNTSLGTNVKVHIDENNALVQYFMDADGDGFGDPEIDTTGCNMPDGYVLNYLDCDDSNPDINPDAEEIADNDIDEDCDGTDLVPVTEWAINYSIQLYPNPASGVIYTNKTGIEKMRYHLTNPQGQVIQSGKFGSSIQLSGLEKGLYLIEIFDDMDRTIDTRKLIVN